MLILTYPVIWVWQVRFEAFLVAAIKNLESVLNDSHIEASISIADDGSILAAISLQDRTLKDILDYDIRFGALGVEFEGSVIMSMFMYLL